MMKQYCEFRQVGAFCICCRCKLKIESDNPAKLHIYCRKQSLRYSLPARVRSYIKAVTRWVLSGLQRRPKADILRILAICKTCEHFTPTPSDPDSGVCNLCSCGCSAEGVLFNKLAMATERCPLSPPKWTEQVTPGTRLVKYLRKYSENSSK